MDSHDVVGADSVPSGSDDAAIAAEQAEDFAPHEVVAMAQRDGAMPIPRANGRNIADYSRGELVTLIEWIESDGLLRTRVDLRDEAIRELGYQRRGPRIVDAINAAIDVTRNS
jgi:hypothetical protein